MCMCVFVYMYRCVYENVRYATMVSSEAGGCAWCPESINLIIPISGTISPQSSKKHLWSVIALEQTVHRPCLGGTRRQLSQWKVCGYFATKNCPKPKGFHSRRNVIAPSAMRTSAWRHACAAVLQDWLGLTWSVPCTLWSLNLTEEKHILCTSA